MSKDDAINIMNGSNLVNKSGGLSIFFIIYKMNEYADLTSYQKNPRRDAK